MGPGTAGHRYPVNPGSHKGIGFVKWIPVVEDSRRWFKLIATNNSHMDGINDDLLGWRYELTSPGMVVVLLQLTHRTQ